MNVDIQIRSCIKVTIISIVSLFILLLASAYIWAYQYKDRIGPNVFMSTTDLSGLSRSQAKDILQDRVDKILSEGIDLSTDKTDTTKKLALATLVGSDLIENVEFNIDQLIDRAMTLSHESNSILNTYRVMANFLTRYELIIPVTLNTEGLKQDVYKLFPEVETLSEQPQFQFSNQNDLWSGEVLLGRDGTEFAFDSFFEHVKTNLEQLDTSPLTIALVSKVPALSNQFAESQLTEAIRMIGIGPINFVYNEVSTQKNQTWYMTERDVSEILKPGLDGVEIDREKFDVFLDTIAGVVERPAQNARIDVENGRVTNFIQSKKGVQIDRDEVFEKTLTTLQNEDIDTQNNTIVLVTNEEEPTITTGDVNDLGITQILGTGTSSYRGSPRNRKTNIQNGVNLLNGLLIAPGETLSLIQALQPFTEENGYLSELVIKGDKIQPELGGGLCQIGTTTFRAVMNSGLKVTERRNHSLVVSYYNDPSNNNPGTDATIYEPAPDFKFTNDTEHYVLFQAENIVDKQELRFTLWGTSDGRKGSYTPPVVLRWIPVGETKRIETTDLEPGKEQCQTAHIGADASFDYSVVKSDGTVETTTFESHYRPLPEICLVGVEEMSVENSEIGTVDNSEETQTNLSELPQKILTP